MDFYNFVVLGGGISGIGAQISLGKKCVVFEKNNSVGGLCDNFSIKGFRFDYAVHFSFTENPQVNKIFLSHPYLEHEAYALNYYKGYWLKHPAQNNLQPLPFLVKSKAVLGFLARKKTDSYGNYQDWLISQYGRFFANKFPIPYTRKYWATEAVDLSTNWVGKRMYRPSSKEVIQGAFSAKTPNTYYVKTMRYPEKGGFKNFFEDAINFNQFFLGYELVEIDTSQKTLLFTNGYKCSYNHLISTLPLPEIIKAIKEKTKDIINETANLEATSIVLVSVGFNKFIKLPSLWFYVYDEDIPFARAYSPSLKSPDNAPENKSSIQCEVYFKKSAGSLNEAETGQRVIQSLIKMGVCNKEDIMFVDVRTINYGNVIFYKEMEGHRDKVIDFLNKKDIISIGRFGKWDYLWSDQSFYSGLTVNQKIIS